MSLLDPDIQNYVFKWEAKDTHGIKKFVPKIQTENEEVIGKIDLEEGLVSKKFYLCNIEESTSLHPKLLDHLYVKRYGLYRIGYDVKGLDDSLIGKINKKSFTQPYILIMKNAKEEEILEFNGDFEDVHVFNMMFKAGIDFEINSIDGQNKAQFRVNQDKVKKGFLRYKYYNTCVLKINDLNFDRKSLLGMFICCMLNILDAVEVGSTPPGND